MGILYVCLVQGRSGRVVFTEECQGKIDGVAPIMKEKTRKCALNIWKNRVKLRCVKLFLEVIKTEPFNAVLSNMVAISFKVINTTFCLSVALATFQV